MPVFETLATIGAGVGIAGAVGGLGATLLNSSKAGKGIPSYTGGQYVPNAGTYAQAQQALQQYVPNASDYASAQSAIQQYVPNAADYASAQSAMQQYVPTAADYSSILNQIPANQANIFNTAANQGLNFAQAGTASNIANQEMVAPGSAAQRAAATNQLNSYINGQVPTDVQQSINRSVAQNLGGGFNLFSGGGQAPQNFARNLGQTSLNLSQYGLSAAPTWQNLANSMVVSPSVGLSAGLQAQGLAANQAQLGTQALTSQAGLALQGAGLANQQVGQQAGLALQGIGLANQQVGQQAGLALQGIGLANQQVGQQAGLGLTSAENQYQAGMNQYGANQLAGQQLASGLGSFGSTGIGLMNAANLGNYYGGLPSAQGANYSSNFGSDQMNSAGGYETTQAASAAGVYNPTMYSMGANSGVYAGY